MRWATVSSNSPKYLKIDFVQKIQCKHTSKTIVSPNFDRFRHVRVSIMWCQQLLRTPWTVKIIIAPNTRMVWKRIKPAGSRNSVKHSSIVVLIRGDRCWFWLNIEACVRRNILRISSAYFIFRLCKPIKGQFWRTGHVNKVFCCDFASMFSRLVLRQNLVRRTPFNAIAQSTSKNLGSILHPCSRRRHDFLILGVGAPARGSLHRPPTTDQRLMGHIMFWARGTKKSRHLPQKTKYQLTGLAVTHETPDQSPPTQLRRQQWQWFTFQRSKKESKRQQNSSNAQCHDADLKRSRTIAILQNLYDSSQFHNLKSDSCRIWAFSLLTKATSTCMYTFYFTLLNVLLSTLMTSPGRCTRALTKAMRLLNNGLSDV